NPGEQYENTRHNSGYLALDYLATQAANAKNESLNWANNKKFPALIYKSGEFIYGKPLTFMNNSGQAVQAILNYYNLLPKKLGFIKIKESDLSEVLTVIQDEMDLPLGQVKLSANSGSAGHRGVESIINSLKTKNFKRIRLGINSESKGQIPTEKFVLQKFNDSELKILTEAITKIEIE
ncbi:MAG: aminoacyl-tRNA hydrolase, partial [Candidatus Falkowbacteria bacterium]|nr:aminoacyl-tRNA hydrolase [Candidatus Falkowbacteria bacterium]